MAMIRCPKCGWEVSDKATRCVRCGMTLIEQPMKFCAECGRRIPINAQECRFCGCPVESEDDEDSLISRVMEHKKPIIIVAVIAIIVVLGINLLGTSLNKDERLAYQNAVTVKKMLLDPDSFKLYDEMYILKKRDDNGKVECTYTIFTYGGTNGYGGITTDKAIFKDEKYIMDYDDDYDWGRSDLRDQLDAKDAALWYAGSLLGIDRDKFQKVDINVAKIKAKMGLK